MKLHFWIQIYHDNTLDNSLSPLPSDEKFGNTLGQVMLLYLGVWDLVYLLFQRQFIFKYVLKKLSYSFILGNNWFMCWLIHLYAYYILPIPLKVLRSFEAAIVKEQ